MTTRQQQFRREVRERRVTFLTNAAVLMGALGVLAYALARLAHAIAVATAVLP